MTTVTQIAQADSGLLLAYSVATTPDPIQVSPQQGDPSKAALTVVVNNPNSDLPVPIYLQQLILQLPVGSASTSLVSPKTTFKAVASPGALWQASDPTEDGTVVITPRSSKVGKITGDGLTIALYDITVNQTVGTTQLTVVEYASAQENGPFDPHDLSVDLGKFPYAFFAGDFHSDAIQVTNGGQTTLHWIGSENATYTLLWNTNTQDVSQKRSWQTPRLFDTTPFYLRVSTTQQGETVTQYFSLTVVVANPNITATTLEVLKETTLDGSLLLKGTATLQNTLNATQGLATFGEAVTNSLNVLGRAQIKQIEATTSFLDNATIKNGLALNGISTLFGHVQTITPNRSYIAPTDGFIVAFVQVAGIDYTQPCLGWATVSNGEVGAICTGGNFQTTAGRGNAPGMVLLPVPRGNQCYGYYQNANGNTVNPQYYFWWIPLGTGNLSETALIETDQEVRLPADLLLTSEDLTQREDR